MKSTLRAAAAVRAAMAAVFAVVACGGAPETEPQRASEDETRETITAEEYGLSSSQTDIEARVYAEALTGRAAEIRPTGKQNGWSWSVVSPRFVVSPSGVRFKGSLVASKPKKLALISKPTTTRSVLAATTSLPRAAFDPRAPFVSGPPSSASTAFDLPATVTFDAGKLRLDVANQAVQLKSESSGAALVSVVLSSYYSGELAIGEQSFVAGSSQLTAALSTVEIVPKHNYIRLRAVVSVN